jgi:hypothetical protein
VDLNGNTEPSSEVANATAAPASIETQGSPEPGQQSPAHAGASKRVRKRALDLRWASSGRAERALSLERGARLALELGDQALLPRGRKQGPSLALACDLYRRSAACSLRALELIPTTESELETAIFEEGAAPARHELPSLLETAPPALLVDAAGSEERARALSQVLALRTFRSFAATDPAELASLAPELAAFARKLLAHVDTRLWRIERPGVLRWLKLLVVFGLLLLAGVALAFGPEKWEASRDLAQGKPWKASSLYPGGCESPAQDCPSGTTFFVHTLDEESPWVEFDLGAVRSVSGVRVQNRTDCCLERAQPLLVLVSTDHEKWREVARNEEKFVDWKASFAPAQARWVRLQTPKRTNLHLKRVRIFP